MLARKKKHFLTYEEQHEVIKKLKSGISNETIVHEYGISMSTCCRLLSRESKLLQKLHNNHETRRKKTSKTSSYECLDDAVLIWFQQARDRGKPINGPILQEKALALSKKFSFSPKFKGSNGWLRNFKRRHGIKSYDFECKEDLTWILAEKIATENLYLENIYNADECGINWQALISFGQQEINEMNNKNESCDKMTMLFCTNATGTNKIPLLTISKAESSECFLKNSITQKFEINRLQYLSDFNNVIYTQQNDSLMDKDIFLLWYKEIFIPHVVDHRKKCGIIGKVILILDNAPIHLSLKILNAVNKDFEVLYLPANVPAMIQPMNRDLMIFFKKQCKMKLLENALFHNEGVEEFLKNFNIFLIGLRLISETWNELKITTLRKVWKPLVGDSCITDDPLFIDQSKNDDTIELHESLNFPYEIGDKFVKILIELNSSLKMTKEELVMWFETNDTDCGWQPLSDDDIVHFINSEKLTIMKKCNNKSDKNSGNKFETIKLNQMDCDDDDDDEEIEIESISIKSEQIDNNERYEYAEFEQINDNVDNSNDNVTIKNECENITLEKIVNYEKNENRLEIMESKEITVSEALDCFMKFKKWSETCKQFSKLHLVCIEEIQNIIIEEKRISF
ncbi:jerky protein homolog-like [Leptopilina boulardi]|uniref:jerky protein homolog-like n=1 Tax=Leptopilina boulardi TaxID=63433 RepID=UPI0021F56175|nr:jerky protein homolog-like [Leptopilina boulardi]